MHKFIDAENILTSTTQITVVCMRNFGIYEYHVKKGRSFLIVRASSLHKVFVNEFLHTGVILCSSGMLLFKVSDKLGNPKPYCNNEHITAKYQLGKKI